MIAAYGQLALAMIMVGANVAIGKIVADSFPVMVFSLLRFGLASLLLWPLAARETGTRLRDGGWPIWRDLFFQAFFGVVLYTFFSLSGVRLTSAASAGIITATLPAAVTVFSALILRERIGLARGGATILAVSGIMIVNFFTPADGRGDHPILGNGLIMGAVLSEALFVIFAKRLSLRLSPLRMAFGLNLFGLIQVLPFGLWQWNDTDFSSIDAGTWLVAIYYILTASIVSLFFWYRGLRRVDAATAGLFTALFPLSAVSVAVLVLGEDLTLAHIGGGALVLTAIFLGTAAARRTGVSQSAPTPGS